MKIEINKSWILTFDLDKKVLSNPINKISATLELHPIYFHTLFKETDRNSVSVIVYLDFPVDSNHSLFFIVLKITDMFIYRSV